MSSSPAPSSPQGVPARAASPERRFGFKLAIVAVLLWGVLLREVNLDRTWGWDESMHAELPAARMVELVRAGEWRGAIDVALACDRYPFVVPVYLAAVQLATGVSELAARTALATLWCLGVLAGAFVVRRLSGVSPRSRAGAAVFVLAASFVPIARLYAPTLFLEASFSALLSFAVLAWLARADPGAGRRADLLAGALFALAFFTKFNYGLLLGLGLALSGIGELVAGARTGKGASTARRLVWFAVPPGLAALWWFVCPLPGGLELGASHRAAFASFLAGNQEFVTPRAMRILDWTTLVAPPGAWLLGALGVLLSLRAWRDPALRTCWLVALALVVPTALHPFHLDRFLLPIATPLWWLAAAGILRLDEVAWLRRPAWRGWVAGLVVLGASIGASRWWQANALTTLSLADADPTLRDYQQAQLDAREVIGRADPLPTGGLRRSEASLLLAWVATEAGPTARVGWIGLSSELSPAALHLGLLARGGSAERFLADAHRELDVTFEGVDPNWTEQQLADFAARFDVVFCTDPPDLARRGNRAFTAKYRRMLVDALGWSERELGTLELDKGLVRYPVRLFACRPPKR